jgi:hypothetical protein
MSQPQYDPTKNPAMAEAILNAHGGRRAQRFDEFTFFLELPFELRSAIWKLNLPNGPENDGERVFPLCAIHPGCWSQYRKQEIAVYPGIKEYPMEEGVLMEERQARAAQAQRYETDMKDVRLLKVCTESRKVFLETFNHELPVYPVSPWKEGVIRFSDATTIFCENLLSGPFSPRVSDRGSKSILEESYEISRWLRSIKKLVVTVSPRDVLPSESYKIGDNHLSNFPSLTSFKINIDMALWVKQLNHYSAMGLPTWEMGCSWERIEAFGLGYVEEIELNELEHRNDEGQELSVLDVGIFQRK